MDCYLDNSATTRPAPEAVAAMRRAMEEGYHNPSALYGPGLAAQRRVDACRDRVLGVLGGGAQVVFTGSGTEADNLAVSGRLTGGARGRVLYSAGEHAAVKEPCQRARERGFDAAEIPLNRQGLADPEAFADLAVPGTALICVMEVNNETGAISPLEELLRIRDRQCPQAAFHVDGVQGFLRRPPGLFSLGVDSYALSAHKIHGPKGVGALVLARPGGLRPLIFGGGQEAGLRSGTENTPGIAGLDAAIAAWPGEHRMRELKLRLFNNLAGAIADLAVNGPDPAGPFASDHILNLSLPPVRGETLLHALEEAGVFVGTGSACSSRSRGTSPVLKAMGVPSRLSDCALRFSLSPHTTKDEIDRASEAVTAAHRRLKGYTRR